ncbi:M48 family metalloprotease [Pendulispora albinea]|uniref:M48 family metalloprotease n=1 Tax=Pendulispora albinea TaxID=2741071 RepID=A0ABZ2M0N2_9BACT
MTSHRRHALFPNIGFALFVVAVLMNLAILAGARSAHASKRDANGRDADYEERVTAELAAESPDAARTFTEATAAQDRGDLPSAHRGFERVIQLLPNNPHAYRRLCHVELRENQDDLALTHCRRAVSLRDLPESESALAGALIGQAKPGKNDLDEAYQHAKRAVEARPDDAIILLTMMHVAFMRKDLPEAKRYGEHLRKIAPDDAETHYAWAIIAAAEGRWTAAHESLEAAKQRGMPEDAYRNLAKKIDEAERSGLGYYAIRGAWILGLWVVGFGLLVGLGWVLSRLVLQAAEKISAAGEKHASAPALLRRVYRAVIWLTCMYFYASLPVVLLGVFAGVGGIFYGFLVIGQIPIKLVLILGLVALVSLWAVLKSLWAIVAPRTLEDPGMPLDLAAEPRLRSVLQEVADRVGTRMVDRVFLTTGTDLAVTERSQGFFKLGARSERHLILGAAVLEGMPVRAFKAVLAHEYGHFKNEDTAGGGFALTMQRSLVTMILELARGGAAHALSPAWWFVRGFHPLFLRISHGASRLQEILADRWAALAYGSESFERGLRHVIDRSIRFDAHASAALKEVIEKKVAVANFYTYTPETQTSEKDLADEFEKVYSRAASPYDSHPPANQRIAWVNALAVQGEPAGAGEEGEAWSLFGNRAGLEEQMTLRIRDNLAGQGIFLADT